MLYDMQPFVHKGLQFVQIMTSPRLDRLSALLEGLEPRVEALPGNGVLRHFAPSGETMLHLHLVSQGRVRMSAAGFPDALVDGPALIICRAATAHTIEPLTTQPAGVLLSARAHLDGPVGALFISEFDRPAVLNPVQEDASLSHVLALIATELREQRCGQPALLNRAGDILFIAILRHLVANPRRSVGLFSGLADARISRALVALHAAPQARWTLEAMAEEAAMSRTAFATRFREVMATPPGKYLAQLRLSIARRTVESGLGLKRAARDSGYRNSSALSRALSRAAHP